jgi:hypothetical protein
MELFSSWPKKRRNAGLQQSILIVLQYKFGSLGEKFVGNVEKLSHQQLENLIGKGLSFKERAELDAWLEKQIITGMTEHNLNLS